MLPTTRPSSGKGTISRIRRRIHGHAADPMAVASVANGDEGHIEARAGLKPALMGDLLPEAPVAPASRRCFYLGRGFHNFGHLFCRNSVGDLRPEGAHLQ